MPALNIIAIHDEVRNSGCLVVVAEPDLAEAAEPEEDGQRQEPERGQDEDPAEVLDDPAERGVGRFAEAPVVHHPPQHEGQAQPGRREEDPWIDLLEQRPSLAAWRWLLRPDLVALSRDFCAACHYGS